jgi:hypothetical protein
MDDGDKRIELDWIVLNESTAIEESATNWVGGG